jgi:hypothetical protein
MHNVKPILLSCVAITLLTSSACTRIDDDPCDGDKVLPPPSYKDIKVVPKDSITGTVLYGYSQRYSPDSVRISTLPAGYANTEEIAAADTAGEDGFMITSLAGTSINPCTGDRIIQTGVIATFLIRLTSTDTDTLSVQNTSEQTTDFFYNGRLVQTAGILDGTMQILPVFK